jgi:hypothetical protein
MSAIRPVQCPYECRKPVPTTLFVRFHPFRSDAEIRECPECRRQAIFPVGESFKKDWALWGSDYVPSQGVRP